MGYGHSPDTGVPILFSKIDLKDGYCHMVVNSQEAWNFAYVLPPVIPEYPPQLVVPYALQIGWTEIPAFFCAATETARDISESSYKSERPMPPHTDEQTVLNLKWDTLPKPKGTKRTFLYLLEVYIYDFISLIHSTNKEDIKRLT